MKKKNKKIFHCKFLTVKSKRKNKKNVCFLRDAVTADFFGTPATGLILYLLTDELCMIPM